MHVQANQAQAQRVETDFRGVAVDFTGRPEDGRPFRSISARTELWVLGIAREIEEFYASMAIPVVPSPKSTRA
jgi:hypothetical protein